MGMGTAPSHAWIISQEQLHRLVPAALANLNRLLASQGKNLSDLALAKAQEEAVSESDEACQAIDAALERLDREFQAATRVGKSCLELELFHYCAAEGSRYDELEEGANWLVDGVKQFTPAGEKFKDRIEWKGWTTFC